MPAPDTAEVTVHWQLAGGDELVNVWHVLRDETGNLELGDAQEISDAFLGFYVNDDGAAVGERGIGPWLSNDCTLTHMKVQWIEDEEPDDPWTITCGQTGSAGSEPLPYANCVLLLMRASSGGRSGLGRKYLGPFADTAIVQEPSATGAPTVGQNTRQAIAAALVDLKSRLVALNPTTTIGIYSRQDSVCRPVTGYEIGNVFRTQRRRQKEQAITGVHSGPL